MALRLIQKALTMSVGSQSLVYPVLFSRLWIYREGAGMADSTVTHIMKSVMTATKLMETGAPKTARQLSRASHAPSGGGYAPCAEMGN